MCIYLFCIFIGWLKIAQYLPATKFRNDFNNYHLILTYTIRLSILYFKIYHLSLNSENSTYRFKKKKMYLFIFAWVLVAAWRLSVVAESRGCSSLRDTGFSLLRLLLLQSIGSRCSGCSSCGMWACHMWCNGLVDPWHVGSSWTRA